MTCPIGVDGINGKQPAQIAISVAAEILQVYDRAHNNQQATNKIIAARGRAHDIRGGCQTGTPFGSSSTA